MKPMLAFKWQTQSKHMPFPCYVQPKLDGIRMMHQEGIMQSRSYGLEEVKRFPQNRLSHIREALCDISIDWILDGELYIHGKSLQQINSMAAVNRIEDSPKTKELEYHVFDVIDANNFQLGFQERHAKIQAVLPRLEHSGIKLVRTILVNTPEEADQYYREFKDQGYEGMMYRDANLPYGFEQLCGNQENRWNRLLKRKDWLDEEFEIIGVQEGIGKYCGMIGSLEFKNPKGPNFFAGSGLTDMDRLIFWSVPPIGRFAKIKFDSKSDAGIPLKPTIDFIFE